MEPVLQVKWKEKLMEEMGIVPEASIDVKMMIGFLSMIMRRKPLPLAHLPHSALFLTTTLRYRILAVIQTCSGLAFWEFPRYSTSINHFVSQGKHLFKFQVKY